MFFLVQKLRHLSCKLYGKCLINICGLHENDSILLENFEGLKAENQIAQYILYLGMAIFARPASTWPGPTLMGRVLPGSIRNRVGYEFYLFIYFIFYKKNPKRVWVGSRF